MSITARKAPVDQRLVERAAVLRSLSPVPDSRWPGWFRIGFIAIVNAALWGSLIYALR